MTTSLTQLMRVNMRAGVLEAQTEVYDENILYTLSPGDIVFALDYVKFDGFVKVLTRMGFGKIWCGALDKFAP